MAVTPGVGLAKTQGGVLVPKTAQQPGDNWANELSYDDLTNNLRRDLSLDATTDLSPGTFLQAVETNPLPYSLLAYNTINSPAIGFVNPGTVVQAGYTLNGGLLKNFGGTRGWEHVAAASGLYRLIWSTRVDVNGYAEVDIAFNGTPNASTGYSIQTGNATFPYGMHVGIVEAFMNAGDALAPSYHASFAGTVFQGLDNGIRATSSLQLMSRSNVTRVV